MYCINCGVENSDSSKFCKNCGKLLKEEEESIIKTGNVYLILNNSLNTRRRGVLTLTNRCIYFKSKKDNISLNLCDIEDVESKFINQKLIIKTNKETISFSCYGNGTWCHIIRDIINEYNDIKNEFNVDFLINNSIVHGKILADNYRFILKTDNKSIKIPYEDIVGFKTNNNGNTIRVDIKCRKNNYFININRDDKVLISRLDGIVDINKKYSNVSPIKSNLFLNIFTTILLYILSIVPCFIFIFKVKSKSIMTPIFIIIFSLVMFYVFDNLLLKYKNGFIITSIFLISRLSIIIGNYMWASDMGVHVISGVFLTSLGIPIMVLVDVILMNRNSSFSSLTYAYDNTLFGRVIDSLPNKDTSLDNSSSIGDVYYGKFSNGSTVTGVDVGGKMKRYTGIEHAAEYRDENGEYMGETITYDLGHGIKHIEYKDKDGNTSTGTGVEFKK